MYNFSGIVHRIWSAGGILLLMGIIGVLIDRYEAKRKGKEFKIKNCKLR